MSLRGKTLSAFAVFKGKKASSMTNVAASPPEASANDHKQRSSSASNTPTTSRETSLSSVTSKLSYSERRKQKAEMKKVKKLLKSASKESKGTRPSYLPDAALHSPLADLNGGNVQLRSLRPKGSMANMRYQLPLKADPALAMHKMEANTARSPPMMAWSQHGEHTPSPTPPLPPRQMRRYAEIPTTTNTDITLSTKVPHRHAVKRGGQGSESPSGLPEEIQVNGFEERDPIPPRPPKRRRISRGSTPSPNRGQAVAKVTPQRYSSIDMSPRGSLLGSETSAREHMEPMPSHPADRDSALPYMYDSQEEAARLFECLIHPVKPAKFFSELWERKPLLVKRHMPNYNDGWFSTEEFDKILREHRLNFSENLDVVTYTDGKRETHNPDGRAYAPVVWDYYNTGCSVRVLNPQTYSRNVWKLLSILQEYFGSFTGANVYLTPPGTQGFAPHWDDIEAFILQLEGKKHWKLYSPRSENDTLPRFSGGNLTDAEIGEPILDVILEAGDLLYFPRGIIHQGRTLEDSHSMHITVSCHQKNTWGDLLEQMVPRALQIALDEDLEFRQSLPREYLNYMGVAFSDSNHPDRQGFLRKIEQLMVKLISHAPVDAACDQMGKKLIHCSLPPVLTEAEKKCSIHGDSGERWDPVQCRVRGAAELEPDTEIKLIRKGIIRLVTEEDKVCIYHNLENTRIYQEKEAQTLEISAEMAPAVEFLLHSYPEYVAIDSLPLDGVAERVELASVLYDKGMLLTQNPLEHMSESESDDDDSDKK